MPYCKFPLQQNKYITEFFKKFEADKEKVDKIIGVHFKGNDNENAEGSVGIEVEIEKKGSMVFIESKGHQKYIVKNYNSDDNFSMC